VTPFIAHSERFDRVGSTNDVVRTWLAGGRPEVCLAVAVEQTAGRGREGRPWVAPAGAALLLSLGFRPSWLAADHAWRLAAVTSLAMADAAETVADLPAGSIRLKWPNDLVIASGPGAGIRKVAGVLGETIGLGSADPRVVVGLGINADWDAARFPPELSGSMTSLREAAGGRRIDSPILLEAFLSRVESAVESLRAGRFDATAWADRQWTTGRAIRLLRPAGDETLRAIGVDPDSGALIVADALTGAGRHVLVGEVGHVRPATPVSGAV
jgi:BirA family biotin operon repressor/biotin-[acetyl-CoA-carboxylase] ligase